MQIMNGCQGKNLVEVTFEQFNLFNTVVMSVLIMFT